MRFPTSRILKLGAAAATLTALAVAPALAAPDHTASLNAGQTEFKWDGGPGNGLAYGGDVGNELGCDTPGYDCDYVHLKVEVAGDLEVKLSEPGANTEDLDLYLYKATAAGEPEGEPVAEQADAEVEEKVKAKVQPGDYVALIGYWLAVEGTYKGTATLKPAGAAAAATPLAPPQTEQPQTQPEQQSQPDQRAERSEKGQSEAKRKAALKKCQKKARRIKSGPKRKKAMKACSKKHRR
jgi:pyruvate/2-oxoglutarate dehydrogenase complex dihydrolipoamide acyltransferase (E2) component